MSWSLGKRLGVTFAAALVAVVALHVFADRFDERHKPKPRVLPQAAPAAATPFDDEAESPPPPRPAIRLQPVRGTIAICRRQRSLALDVAPVVEVLADGELVLRRPEPLAARPGERAGPSRDGHGAAVVLPADPGELGARARSALLLLLGRWIEERPIATARVVAVDLDLPAGELRRLLSWVP